MRGPIPHSTCATTAHIENHAQECTRLPQRRGHHLAPSPRPQTDNCPETILIPATVPILMGTISDAILISTLSHNILIGIISGSIVMGAMSDDNRIGTISDNILMRTISDDILMSTISNNILMGIISGGMLMGDISDAGGQSWRPILETEAGDQS